MGKGNDDDYMIARKEFDERATGIIKYFNSEFGGKLRIGKIFLKHSKCGNKRCKSCPHGPYWYRATFNPKTRRWIAKYIGVSLSKSKLKSAELEMWDRYKFFSDEIKRLHKERKKRLKELRSITSPSRKGTSQRAR